MTEYTTSSMSHTISYQTEGETLRKHQSQKSKTTSLFLQVHHYVSTIDAFEHLIKSGSKMPSGSPFEEYFGYLIKSLIPDDE
jgi:hypothetical protein